MTMSNFRGRVFLCLHLCLYLCVKATLSRPSHNFEVRKKTERLDSDLSAAMIRLFGSLIEVRRRNLWLPILDEKNVVPRCFSSTCPSC